LKGVVWDENEMSRIKAATLFHVDFQVESEGEKQQRRKKSECWRGPVFDIFELLD
jgi:hypothetical protein